MRILDDYLQTLFNYRILQTEKQISDSEFTERFNAATGKEWKVPYDGNVTGSIASSSDFSKLSISKIGPCFFKFHLLAEPPVFMKEANVTSMENFCKRMCEKRNLDYDAHSFEFGDKEHRPVEMDQPFFKYATKVNFDLYLVKKSKVYAAISTVENTEETLVTNYIEGR